VSICPEFDIASQGDTIEEARENLREALELFFETASPNDLARFNPSSANPACRGASLSYDRTANKTCAKRL
jgi:hypothetical protein